MMSEWIFIFVIIPPGNSYDSRAPFGLPRARCGATSYPHSSPMTCRRKNGCRAQLGERGALYVGLPGTSLLAPRNGGESLKKRKSQHDTGLNSARTCERPGVRVHCCIAVVSLRGWVGRLVREGWLFGRCVCGGRAGSLCGSRVLQFRFLDPWCFHHHYYSLDDRPPRSNCSFTSTAVRHCCARVLL